MIGKLRMMSIVWLYNLQKKHEPNTGISVIICAHNNLEALEQNLHTILSQNYHQYEVIVVNDFSDDGTREYLDELKQMHAHLQVIHLEEKNLPGKKQALKTGISHAIYPFVVLTDADCSAASNDWLSSYSQYTQQDNTIILGYGKYKKQKGFLNLFIRFDTSRIAIQYMSKALWRYPYMGVGRNMGYSKHLGVSLDEVDPHLASGDDDLFIQATKKRASFVVLIDKNSFTISEPKNSWQAWLQQKGRHTTTAPHYSLGTQIGLIFHWLVNVLFYLGVFCILLTGNLQTGFALFTLNLLCLGLFNGLWLNKLGEKDLILSAPFLDFIYTFVQPVFVIKSWGRKKNQWN